MSLFRTRTPKSSSLPEALPKAAPQALNPVATKKVEALATNGAHKSSVGLQDLGIYTLPNELKNDFRKLREDVQRFLVEGNHIASANTVKLTNGTLNIFGKHVATTNDDHIFDSPAEHQLAIEQVAEVTRTQPPVVEQRRSSIRPFVVPGRYRGATD